ncbi:hypothetical protein TNCV_3402491 [Trichonephila clavipes]|nr:hypothetical protein TNCV_3402491 [Trichonephila clavipes]
MEKISSPDHKTNNPRSSSLGCSCPATSFTHIAKDPHDSRYLPNRLFKPRKRATFMPRIVSDWRALRISTGHPLLLVLAAIGYYGTKVCRDGDYLCHHTS